MITVYLGAYPRIWQGGHRLEHVHRTIEAKTKWIEHTFEHYCAMIMLNGEGRVQWENKDIRIPAPFILLARPGIRYAYGPEKRWDETGFIFTDQHMAEDFEQFPREPWPVRNENILLDQLRRVELLLDQPAAPGAADQLDMLACTILTSSLHGKGESLPEGPKGRIYAVERWLRTHYKEPFELRDVIQRFGFSEPTFRRLWKKNFPRSPWQYVLTLRLHEARRLLQNERDLSVSEISYACGFTDQRYFATLFKRETGKTPTEYRD